MRFLSLKFNERKTEACFTILLSSLLKTAFDNRIGKQVYVFFVHETRDLEKYCINQLKLNNPVQLWMNREYLLFFDHSGMFAGLSRPTKKKSVFRY